MAFFTEEKTSRLVERDLLALEVAEASAVGRATTTAAATATTAAEITTTAAATATAATETTTATATATATTAEAAAATAVVVVARSSEVQADRAAIKVGALESIESALRLIDGAEANVTEALGHAILRLGGQGNTGDGAVLLEELGDAVGGSVEGQVADEEGVGGPVGRIAVPLGAVVGAVPGVLAFRTRSAEVKVERAAIEVRALLSVESSSSSLNTLELNITESVTTTAAAW